MLKEIKTIEGIYLSTNVVLEGETRIFRGVKKQSWILRNKNQLLLYTEILPKKGKPFSEITVITSGVINVEGINQHRVNHIVKDMEPFNWDAFDQLQEV